MPANDLRYLAVYFTRGEAEMMKGLLKENGIKCFLQFNDVGDALMGGLGSSNGPTELWVLPEHLEIARELIGKKGKV